MRLDEQTDEQIQVLHFWLQFFREHADLLQRGTLTPARPDLGFPVIQAEHGSTMVIARYVDAVVRLTGQRWRTAYVVNACESARLVLDVDRAEDIRYRVYASTGQLVEEAWLSSAQTVQAIAVPVGGLVTLI